MFGLVKLTNELVPIIDIVQVSASGSVTPGNVQTKFYPSVIELVMIVVLKLGAELGKIVIVIE